MKLFIWRSTCCPTKREELEEEIEGLRILVKQLQDENTVLERKINRLNKKIDPVLALVHNIN